MVRVRLKVLYLAHPLPCRKWVRKAELVAEEELGIKLVNPFYDQERGDSVRLDELDNGSLSRDEYNADLDADVIASSDLSLIDKAQGTLAVFTRKQSIGTICEATYTKMSGKPVFAVVYSDALRVHPWVRWLSGETKDRCGFLYKDFADWRKAFKEMV